MKYSCMRSAAFLVFLVLPPRAWAQSPPVVKIDPAGEHSRVHLSLLDATTQKIIARRFDPNIPINQYYKPFALLLTNASGKSIVALSIRWMAISTDETGYYDSSIDSLHLSNPGSSSGHLMGLPRPGQSLPAQTQVRFGQSHVSAGEPEVLFNGERMMVAPGLFIRESSDKPGGSSIPKELIRAETVWAILDTVVLQDGEVLGSDASCMVDSLRERKTTIDVLLNGMKIGEQRGLDGVEILKQMANDPLRFSPLPQIPENDPGFQLKALANELMISRDWKQRLEKLSAIQLPNFYR